MPLSIPPNKMLIFGVLGVGAFLLARQVRARAGTAPRVAGRTTTPGQGGVMDWLKNAFPVAAAIGGRNLSPADVANGSSRDASYGSATDPANRGDDIDVGGGFNPATGGSGPNNVFEDGYDYNPDGATIGDIDPGPEWSWADL